MLGYCLFVYCLMNQGQYTNCSTDYGLYEKRMTDKVIDELAVHKNSVSRSYCSPTEKEVQNSDLWKAYKK